MLKLNKIISYALIAFWIAFAFNLLQPFDGNWGVGIHWLGVVMLVVHVVELVLVYSKLKAAGHTSLKDIVAVLAFGILYWKPIIKS
ncbi:DUF1145 domain-containing protein [Porticoccaceae bacterium nBUS_17]